MDGCLSALCHTELLMNGKAWKMLAAFSVNPISVREV